MEKKSIYAAYEEIKRREIDELKKKLRAFGCVAHFGPDYTGEGATGADCPIVMCNIEGFEPHPADVKITSVGVEIDGEVTIMGYEIDKAGGSLCCYDEREISLGEIAYGHIEFITNAIPEVKTMKIYVVHVDAISSSWQRHFNEISNDEIEEMYRKSDGLIQCYNGLNEFCKSWNCGEVFYSDFSYIRIINP